MEEWRDIPGYEGMYQVSSLGRARSLDRLDAAGRRRKGRVLKLTKMCTKDRGYLGFSVHKNGVQDTRLIAIMVAMLFIGPRPEGMECCHGDGDRANNAVGNLRWDTPKANGEDKVRHGTSASGDRNGRAKLSMADVVVIKERLANGAVINQLRKEFNVHFATIKRIAAGETWSSV